jgi:SAM-dependent methyltransferase
VTGVDASADAVAFARDFYASPEITYQNESAGSFAFPHEAYDRIVSFETIEHLADDARFVNQLWDALRPGGVLAVSAPNLETYPMRGHVFHVRHYSPASLSRLMTALPGAAWTRLIGQVDDGRLAARAEGKHLIGLVGKSGPGLLDPSRIDRLLPYTTVDHPDVWADRLHFRPERFEFNRPVEPADVMRLGLAHETGTPVFGPNAKLRPGSYRVEYWITLEMTAGAEALMGRRLVLDVMNTSYQVLARLDFAEQGLLRLCEPDQTLGVDFEHDDADTRLQFRVRIEGPPVPAVLVFKGVDLMRHAPAAAEHPAGPPQAAVRLDPGGAVPRWHRLAEGLRRRIGRA